MAFNLFSKKRQSGGSISIDNSCFVDGANKLRFSNCLIAGTKSYGRDSLLRELIADSLNCGNAVFVIQNGTSLPNNSLRNEFTSGWGNRTFFSMDFCGQGFTQPINLFKGSSIDFVQELLLLLMSTYGYIMELYDNKKYASFVKLIKGKVAFPSKETQIETLIELVDAFEELHAQGYSYQDLNDGGVLLDCQNGRVLVCDNDNVSPYGVNLGIIGKFKYMAPEVAIKMFKPDKHSDRFSLAVLMFLLLLHAHPFDGIKRLSGQLTPALQEKIYGTEPVFIFHPTDKSNRPDPQIDANALKAWPLLPDFIQDLFIKTFTSGMPSIGKKRDELERERQDRVSEKDWREALHRWMDTMANCPKCNHSVLQVKL